MASIACLALAPLTAQAWSQRNTLTAPSPRNSAAMAYDIDRGVAVLFGGYDGTNVALGDTWESNPIGWVRRTVAVAPPARWGHGMAFDTRRSQVVLFGGFTPSGGSVNDTWMWNGTVWQQVAPAASPAARAYFGIAYDSIRGRTVVHGGLGNSLALLGDTWEFDGASWAQSAAVAGPGGRRGAAMTFDDTRGQVVLFGGGDGMQVFGDTWSYDGAAWTLRTTTGPSPRWQAQIEHDTLCGRAVLHGGADAAFGTNYGDSWAWDGSSWTQLLGTSPSARHGAASAFDAQRGQTVLFGGRDTAGFKADTWQLGSPCSRTMSVVTQPQVGGTATFRFDYPNAAAGHFYFHLLTARQLGSYAVPIPGIASIGVSRVDLFNIYLQPSGLLDASGSNLLNVAIPPDSFLVGLPFDVQTLDFNFLTNTLYWANNDAEVSIAPVVPPVASFTATPTVGQAPLVVQFTDTSTDGPTSWQWDFDNDGVVDSTAQNPTHTYAVAGQYSVRLVVARLGASSTETRSNLIYAGPTAPSSTFNMVPVPSGTFLMGSVAGLPREQSVHAVTIGRPFWVSRFEVTQAEFQARMGFNPAFFQGAMFPGSSLRPVEQVSFADANSYCSAVHAAEVLAGRVPLGYQYRLPTEAEWEYFCRAGTASEWNTGASIDCAVANIAPCGPAGTVGVGSYPANAWGIHDTHGNVSEWCLDTYDGSSGYSSGTVGDPYVTATGPFRSVRGGNWFEPAFQCRSAFRPGYLPHMTDKLLGFRMVLAPVLLPDSSLNMVRIGSGTFQMGSNAGSAAERPVHAVTISRPFWMGRFEVTQAEYQSAMGNNPSYFSGAQRPVERVTWNGAMAYCAAITASESAAGRVPSGYQYRLPTEAEWEYCCRAGTTSEWNTGATINVTQANFNDPFSGQTRVVGSFAPNAWGLSDMHGNVWEWCLDSWDQSANYSAGAIVDPYVSIGTYRPNRGGGWLSLADPCRSAFRYGNNGPGSSYWDVGFRVCLAPILVP